MSKAKKKVKIKSVNDTVVEAYVHGEVMSGLLVSREKETMNLFHITKDQIIK